MLKIITNLFVLTYFIIGMFLTIFVVIPEMIATENPVWMTFGIGLSWFVIITFIVFAFYLFDKVFEGLSA